MANKIAFEIETDSSYTPAEKSDLLDAFVDFMNEQDGAIIEGTEDISIVNSDDVFSDGENEVLTKAKKLIKSGNLTVRIQLDTEDDNLFDTEDMNISVS